MEYDVWNRNAGIVSLQVLFVFIIIIIQQIPGKDQNQ